MSAEVLAVGTPLLGGTAVESMVWKDGGWVATSTAGGVHRQTYCQEGLWIDDHHLLPWPPPPLKAGDVVSVEGRVVKAPKGGPVLLTVRDGSVWAEPEDVTFVRHGHPGEPYVEPEVLAVGMDLGASKIVELIHTETVGWLAITQHGGLLSESAGPDLLLRDGRRLPWPPKPEAKS